MVDPEAIGYQSMSKIQTSLNPWEQRTYIRSVWNAINDLQQHLKNEDGHYIEKCKIDEYLQLFKNVLREDLKKLGPFYND